MKVLNFTRPENGLIHDLIYNLGFEKFESVTPDCYLFMADFIRDALGPCYRDKPRIALTLEEPNFLIGNNDSPHAHLEENVDKILTLCPYTAKALQKRTSVFLPTNEEFIPVQQDKIWDVLYAGSIPRCSPWPSFMDVMREFKYRDIYYSRGTNPCCTYREKFTLYAQTKIALVHCLCIATPNERPLYTSFKGFKDNEAFTHLLIDGTMPQIKSRVFEAAFSRTIILCWKDHWNVIEKFFNPDTDFLYFTDADDLRKKIRMVLEDYNNYQPMIESAYNRAVNNYTSRHFIEKYIGVK